MKKSIITLSIVALTFLTVTPAGAKNSENKHHGWGFGKFFKVNKNHELEASRFMVSGTVASESATSFVVTSDKSVNANLVNNQATITASAEILGKVSVGDKVMVAGTVSGTTLTATKVHVTEFRKAVGSITAKTDTSVTIKNNLTGTTQTVTTDADTKVQINGEAKTVADIQVGDSGWVKFKSQAGVMVAKFINLFR